MISTRKATLDVGWNCGKETFHAHLHVIPRFEDEPLAGKSIRHWLKQTDKRRLGHQ
jgi:histidine triad (HIT) family protein